MKLSFRDLKQQKFVIEAEVSETVLNVKEKIEGIKGWAAATQKLIYSGKILQDGNTIESYNIQEKDFIVCMTSKPKVAAVKPLDSDSAAKASTIPPATPAPASIQTPAAPQAAAQSDHSASNVPATPSPNPTSGASNTTSLTAVASPAEFNSPSTLALGAQRDAAIANMEGMGFDRADIDRAMRAAYFNPDRAVEYLLNGIPDNVREDSATGPARTSSAVTANPAAGLVSGDSAPADTDELDDDMEDDGGEQPINLFEAAAQANRGPSGGAGRQRGSGGLRGAASASDSGGAANLDFLRGNPQFQQLRQILQTQPRMLEPMMQQIGNGNPQLAQLITENPEQFLRLLSEDAGDDMPLPPGAQEISVTEEERDAIERLCQLGFERELVIQAYFAFDKNEDLAANFLFDQTAGDMDAVDDSNAPSAP